LVRVTALPTWWTAFVTVSLFGAGFSIGASGTSGVLDLEPPPEDGAGAAPEGSLGVVPAPVARGLPVVPCVPPAAPGRRLPGQP
jgi:hypothetical protein